MRVVAGSLRVITLGVSHSGEWEFPCIHMDKELGTF